jgi:hypothetical protein
MENSIFFNNIEILSHITNVSDLWYDKLSKIEQYINENKKLPKHDSNNKEVRKLYRWMCRQQINYKNKQYIEQNNTFYKLWSKFIKDYENYFKTSIERWKNNLNKLKDYINENKSLPKQNNYNYKYKKLNTWLYDQKYNYKYAIRSMRNKEIYNLWKEFIEDVNYKHYFTNNVNKK